MLTPKKTLLVIVSMAILLTAACSGKLEKLDREAKVFVESAITAITSSWDQTELTRLVDSSAYEGFSLRKIDDLFFHYKKLGPLNECREIKGQVVFSTTSSQGKIISGMYHTEADFRNGPATITVNCIRIDNEWRISGFYVNSEMIKIPEISVLLDEKQNRRSPVDNETVEKEAADLNESRDIVRIRRNVDDLYDLSRNYEASGDIEKAIGFYEKALTSDAGNLSYQIRLSKLLLKSGRKQEATEKLRMVYQYAEDESVFDEAEEMLKKENVSPPSIPLRSDVDQNIEIVLVPLGNVDRQVLSELRILLQNRMGIAISILDSAVEMGEPDRKGSEPYFSKLFTAIQENLSREQHEALLKELDISGDQLAGMKYQERYINKYFAHLGESGAVLQNRIYSELNPSGQSEQYLALNLIERLRETVPFGDDKRIKGYLGVTSRELYCPTCNFLYGKTSGAYGVISYGGFTAVANSEQENRQRLLKRLLKQALSSANFILGIPRCNSPYCARAYAHSLSEQDAKEDYLCSICLSKLEVLKSNPISKNRAGELYALGESFLKAGEYDLARTYCHLSIEEKPDNAEAYWGLGTVYLNEKMPEEAMENFREANALMPNSAFYGVRIGDTYLLQDKYQEAADQYAMVLEKEPDFTAALIGLGRCYMEMKQFDNAVPYFEKVISEHPEEKKQFTNLASCYNETGKPEKAFRTLKNLIEIHPDYPGGYYSLAYQFKEKRDYLSAVEHLQKAIELSPRFIEAYRLMGTCYANGGSLDRSITTFQQGIALSPDDDVLHNDLGYTHYLKKDFPQALESYKKALEVNPKNALCQYNMALAYYALHQFENAKVCCEKANALGYKGSPEFREAIEAAL